MNSKVIAQLNVIWRRCFFNFVLSIFMILPIAVLAMGDDDPLLSMIMLDQFEWRTDDNEDIFVFEGSAWFGYDLNKIWIKSDLEIEGGDTEESEIQLLYGKSVTPFWDLLLGLRHDALPNTGDDWLVFGVHGLAPYYLEIDAALFLSQDNQVSLRLEVEYEWLFSQQTILVADFEANANGQNNRTTGIGSGLADIELGLRLHYEVNRQFAPYIGVSRFKKHQNTADFLRANGEEVSGTEWIVGVHVWF